MAVSNCTVSCGMFGGLIGTRLEFIEYDHLSRAFLANTVELHRAFLPAQGAASLSFWVIAVTGCAFTVSHFGVLLYMAMHK